MTTANSGNFFMLVGIPGSGKSYVAKRICEERTLYFQTNQIDKKIVVVSSDSIREELYGSEDIQGDNVQVFSEMRRRTELALKNGDDVIYDACNVNAKKRISFLKSLSFFRGPKICVICATPFEQCRIRNAQRTRTVPEEVLGRMYKNWNTPYYNEGWDSIIIAYPNDWNGAVQDPEAFAKQYMNYQQDNPFHRETLGEHLWETRQYVMEKEGCKATDNLAIAALLHDCGKPFTKSFINGKGETTAVAHYYQHACVGSYDALFFQYSEKTIEDILEISMLINVHMNPFSWETEKVLEKQEKLLGKELFRKVLILHEADEAASKSNC